MKTRRVVRSPVLTDEIHFAKIEPTRAPNSAFRVWVQRIERRKCTGIVDCHFLCTFVDTGLSVLDSVLHSLIYRFSDIPCKIRRFSSSTVLESCLPIAHGAMHLWTNFAFERSSGGKPNLFRIRRTSDPCSEKITFALMPNEKNRSTRYRRLSLFMYIISYLGTYFLTRCLFACLYDSSSFSLCSSSFSSSIFLESSLPRAHGMMVMRSRFALRRSAFAMRFLFRIRRTSDPWSKLITSASMVILTRAC